MKSIEEKAKAYDEALEKAKEIVNDQNASTVWKRWLCNRFPELCENEDESVYEEIYKDLHTYYMVQKEKFKIPDIKELWDSKWSKAKAWLEKQGEQKPADTCDSSTINSKEFPAGEKRDFGYFSKPADKVEPKFKVGQTIKKEGFNSGFPIVKIENGFYYNDMGDNFPFTDQDNWELVEQKPITEIKSAEESLGIDSETYNKIVDECIYGDDEQKPADKVEPFDEYEGLTDFERTLADICIGWIGQELGWKQYIKDNADVLLKIAIKKFNSVQDTTFEQKPAKGAKGNDREIPFSEQEPVLIIPKFRVGDEIKTSNEESLTITKIDKKGYWSEDLFICGFGGECLWDLVEQKPAWSEEDEAVLNALIRKLEGEDVHVSPHLAAECLKSLKDRYTWKPSDEQIKALEDAIEFLGCTKKVREDLKSLHEQLKKLREV